ncbi:biotin/lipoate A/B protein ligase [Desulfoluna limicola]|uniref:Biotin/lipoate A/B protein ligase n=1 Tax=Desulfoluna limicola TaxID=2810562 RepID=A0ABM7PFB4_9BACT|nr:DUF116 domain-containing protein [Desulfoluna limicola]BCS95764.1 biotin/lipoate A/B protein ligase [Desulfoluna limicola]
MEKKKFRLLDLPPMSAADNMALDETLLELRGKNCTPDTFRFLQFSPATVLVGYNQCVAEEVRTGYVRENGIDINRRITGGGAILFDESQLGWEVICGREVMNATHVTVDLLERLCQTTVNALARFGLDAGFRGKNDVEINGRKISGTGGTEHHDALLFQGSLLIDFDVDTMLKSLMIPIEKLKDKEVNSVKERVTCLSWELKELPPLKEIKKAMTESFAACFGIVLEPSGLTEDEQILFEEKRVYFRSEEWINRVRRPSLKSGAVSASYKSQGGMVRHTLIADMDRKRVKHLFMTGDFLTYPSRALYDLESALRNMPLDRDRIKQMIRSYFEKGLIEIPDMSCEEFLNPLDRVFDKVAVNAFGIPLENCNRISVTNGTFEDVIMKKPSVLLLPYCSKKTDCALRYEKGCGSCGKCTVGMALNMAKAENMTPICITSFEDLASELRDMSEKGVSAFIGCCCEPFFTKHVNDFEAAGIPGILLDIDNTTCYELDLAEKAYAGEYERQTALNLGLLAKVLKVVHGHSQV